MSSVQIGSFMKMSWKNPSAHRLMDFSISHPFGLVETPADIEY